MSEVIAKVSLQRPEDVFILRQNGRIAAQALGFDDADQIRLATALSEIGREALTHGANALAIFSIEGNDALLITVEDFPRAATIQKHVSTGLNAVRKLVNELIILDGKKADTVTLQVRRNLTGLKGYTDSVKLRISMSQTTIQRPLEQLRLENLDLIATLESLQKQREELALLNAELEETNRGVMAMYTQLAGELEETNRGVVALYAELDEKSQKLNEANEAKSRFLASVSHELRSPVSSILGLANVLLDPDAETLSEDQRKQISLTRGAAAELLALVNDLLDLAKAESGRLSPEYTMVDLDQLFIELRGSLRPLVRSGVEFIIAPAHLPEIEIDRTLLMQILRNLLTNALKFTVSGSVQLIAQQPSLYEITLEVRDTGIGISVEDQPRVFEEFYQVRNPLQTEHKGTGLGLPYVMRVTQALDGKIDLQSTVGQGTQVTVTLPIHSQPFLSTKTAPIPNELLEKHVGTILLVDDDDRFRAVLRGLLQHTATTIVETSGGLEGLKAMRTLQPDLVFVDLKMPDMGGAEVLAEMMSDPTIRHIPTIVVSSAEHDVADDPRLKTAVAFMTKSNVNRPAIHEVILRAFP